MKKQNIDKTSLKQTFLGFCLALVLIFIVAAIVLFIQTNSRTENVLQNDSYKPNVPVQNSHKTQPSAKQTLTPTETLAMIDKYQLRYFSIVKRNNLFLQMADCEGCRYDRKDLSGLYSEIISKIDSNNSYIKKYCDIENKYTENTGETTYEINMFESNYYEAVDKLLNEAYQAVKARISQEDFKNLTSSELKWLKDVKAYEKVFEEWGFGSTGTLIKLGYEIDMRKFRTLLLMLYL